MTDPAGAGETPATYRTVEAADSNVRILTDATHLGVVGRPRLDLFKVLFVHLIHPHRSQKSLKSGQIILTLAHSRMPRAVFNVLFLNFPQSPFAPTAVSHHLDRKGIVADSGNAGFAKTPILPESDCDCSTQWYQRPICLI